MPSQAQRPISVCRTAVLAGITTLLITTVASTMSAQNTVPRPPPANRNSRLGPLFHPVDSINAVLRGASAPSSSSRTPAKAGLSTTTALSTAIPMHGKLRATTAPTMSSAIHSR